MFLEQTSQWLHFTVLANSIRQEQIEPHYEPQSPLMELAFDGVLPMLSRHFSIFS